MRKSLIGRSDMENYICKVASLDELVAKWDYEISNNPGDQKWQIWKERAIDRVTCGQQICYVGTLNGEVITEAYASISPECVQNSENLVGEHSAYLSAFRTNTPFQGRGYFSALYKFMESDLRRRGYKTLTIRVEPTETKNFQIYTKWGFTNFLKTAYEVYPPSDENSPPEKVLVNYYSKTLD